MKTYRLLGIVLGLLGVGCDGGKGVMGDMGAQGEQGPMGPMGAMGAQGPKGDRGDPSSTIVTSTCSAVAGNFSCDVSCEGIGSIAIAYAGWEAIPDQGNTLYLNSNSHDLVDPGTWHFDFGTEGVTVGVPVTTSVVCFTPPE